MRETHETGPRRMYQSDITIEESLKKDPQDYFL